MNNLLRPRPDGSSLLEDKGTMSPGFCSCTDGPAVPGGAPWLSTGDQQGHTVKRAIRREPEGSHPAPWHQALGKGTTPLPLSKVHGRITDS